MRRGHALARSALVVLLLVYAGEAKMEDIKVKVRA
jgi:hypothetical protein